MSSGEHPENDIRQALHTVGEGLKSSDICMRESLSDTMTHHGARQDNLNMLRFGLLKCSLMAEKYPWQTTAALLVSVGCGFVCGYFGATVLAALILFAVCAEE